MAHIVLGPPGPPSSRGGEAAGASRTVHRRPVRRSHLLIVALVAALVLLIAAVAVLAGSESGSGSSTTSTTRQPGTGGPATVLPTELPVMAARLGHSIYWAGATTGATYEVRLVRNDVYLRYLPTGTAVGAAGTYLTVGTYQMNNAYQYLASAAKVSGARSSTMSGGALVVQPAGTTHSTYFAFPGTHLLMEVYSPTAGRAWQLVVGGTIQPVNPS